MPELPPVPTLPPDFTVPSIPPELLEPPSTLPPELTEPPPAVPTDLAVPSVPHPPRRPCPSTTPHQAPPAAGQEQSASLAQIAALAARVRALEADLSDAPAPYAEVIADGLDDADPVLAAADTLVAGQQVPITAIGDLSGFPTTSRWPGRSSIATTEPTTPTLAPRGRPMDSGGCGRASVAASPCSS